jgi:hypothetical protein
MCTQTRWQQRVKFSEVHKIAVVDTIDDADKPAIWYTKKDLSELRQSLGQCSCDDCSLSSSESACCTCTPLPSSTPSTSTEERKLRKDFIASLLRQQCEHQRLGLADPKGLFQFSRACTKKSRQDAIKKAKEHEKEVKSFMEQRKLLLGVIDEAMDVLVE